MEERNIPGWASGHDQFNIPRSFVEEKLRHTMFDHGWKAWELGEPFMGSRYYEKKLPREPFRAFPDYEIGEMVSKLLRSAAGITTGRAGFKGDELVIGFYEHEMQKLQQAVAPDGPGEQRSKVITPACWER